MLILFSFFSISFRFAAVFGFFFHLAISCVSFCLHLQPVRSSSTFVFREKKNTHTLGVIIDYIITSLVSTFSCTFFLPQPIRCLFVVQLLGIFLRIHSF